jgi:hypothetical protein
MRKSSPHATSPSGSTIDTKQIASAVSWPTFSTVSENRRRHGRSRGVGSPRHSRLREASGSVVTSMWNSVASFGRRTGGPVEQATASNAKPMSS